MSQRIDTVLAVDSDEDGLCLLKSILRLRGFDVLEAANEYQAVCTESKNQSSPILRIKVVRKETSSSF
jgi:hypothetical protein